MPDAWCVPCDGSTEREEIAVDRVKIEATIAGRSDRVGCEGGPGRITGEGGQPHSRRRNAGMCRLGTGGGPDMVFSGNVQQRRSRTRLGRSHEIYCDKRFFGKVLCKLPPRRREILAFLACRLLMALAPGMGRALRDIQRSRRSEARDRHWVPRTPDAWCVPCAGSASRVGLGGASVVCYVPLP